MGGDVKYWGKKPTDQFVLVRTGRLDDELANIRST